MLISRVKFCATIAIIMLSMLAMGLHPMFAGTVTVIGATMGYVVIVYSQSMFRRNLLEDKCDPEAFLAETEKQRKHVRRGSKMDTYLEMDRAAGLMALGEFEQARKLLMAIDNRKLNRNIQFVHIANLIGCHYQLGDMEQAEELYESRLKGLAPTNKLLQQAPRMLAAERLYYIGEHEDSKRLFSELLKEKTSRHMRLGITYLVALMDEASGDMDSARSKFREVAEQGNKLDIAQQAQKKITGGDSIG